MPKIPTYYPLIATSTTTAQTLPENVIAISACWMGPSTNTAVTNTQLTPVTGTPGTTQVQFAGSVTSPSASLTLGVAPVTGQKIEVWALRAPGSPIGY